MRKSSLVVLFVFNTLYVADLKETGELHGVEGVHIKTVIFEMKDQFLDYFSACDNVHKSIVAPIS